MDVTKLDEEELSYELRVRGIAEMHDINEMRNILRGLLRIEIEGKSLMTTNSSVSIDVKSEVKTCVKKLQVINTMINNIKGDRYSEQYRSVDAKLCHLMNRVDKIPAIEQQDKKDRSNLLKGILFLMRKMEEVASNTTNIETITNQNDNSGNAINPLMVVNTGKIIKKCILRNIVTNTVTGLYKNNILINNLYSFIF